MVLAALAARRPRPHRTQAPGLILLGVEAYSVAYGALYLAEQRIPSGTAAVLYCIAPLVVGLLSQRIAGESRGPRYFLGSSASLAGVAILLADGIDRSRDAFTGTLLALTGAVSGSFGTVRAKRLRAEIDPVWMTALSMLAGGPILGLAAWGTEPWPSAAPPAQTWLAMGYLIFVGSSLAFGLFYSLMNTFRATTLSMITLITPVGAVLIGIGSGEPLVAVRFIVGSCAALGGLGYALTDKPAKA